jgi:hypothetical protein
MGCNFGLRTASVQGQCEDKAPVARAPMHWRRQRLTKAIPAACTPERPVRPLLREAARRSNLTAEKVQLFRPQGLTRASARRSQRQPTPCSGLQSRREYQARRPAQRDSANGMKTSTGIPLREPGGQAKCLLRIGLGFKAQSAAAAAAAVAIARRGNAAGRQGPQMHTAR